MTNQELKKEIKRELKSTERYYDVKSWEDIAVERMEAGEAYSRGYYRACQMILEVLN